MKTTLYYFSGTGNSLYLTKELASQLSEPELVPIASLNLEAAVYDPSERIGIISPLYFSGLPEIVLRFLEKLECPNKKHLFLLVNRGTEGMGGALRQAKRVLTKRKITLDAGYYLLMPDNYVRYLEIPDTKSQKRLFQKATNRLSHLADRIKVGEKTIEPEWLSFIYYFVYPSWKRHVNTADKRFLLDENCTGCGQCERICPVENIKMVDGRPQWQHECQECLACLHFCPAKAIQCGGKSKKHGRYHHPDVTAQEIASQRIKLQMK